MNATNAIGNQAVRARQPSMLRDLQVVGSNSAFALVLALVPVAGCSTDVEDTIPSAEDPARANEELRLPPEWDPLPFPRPPRLDPEEFIEITAGGTHTCARKRNGNVYCWGLNSQGQIGMGTSRTCSGQPCVDRPTRVTDASFAAASQVEAGYDHTCAITPAGVAFCWGSGNHGQVGVGPGIYGSFSSPMAVYGGRTYNSISAGMYSTCATAATQIYCWGSVVHGGGAAGSGANVPTLVWDAQGGVPATSVSTGYLHACAMWTNGGAYREVNCWGANRFGQSGANMQWFPTTAPIGAGPDLGGTALRVATQNNFTCADQPGPTVQCFGDNYWGQLGNGQMTASPTWQPQTVGSGLAVRSVTTGLNHACALDANGAAHCWGNGYWGQLGHGVSGLSSTPAAVGGGLTFKAIAAGQLHTCAIGTNNHIYCWGANTYGQLGTQYPGGWVSNPVQALDP